MLQAIISVFQSSPKELFNYKQISKKIGIENQVQKLQVVDLLYDLSAEDIITEVDRGRYRLNGLGTIAVGTFTRRSNGKNSFLPEDGGTPVFVAERNSKHAMDGDKVKVQLFAKRRGAEPEGEVVEILESKERTFVGKLQVAKGFAFLITESKTLANDIFIPKNKLKGGKNGDKAIVRIMEWPEDAKNPLGEVIDILGSAGQNNAEMHAILAEFGLPYKYPAAVEKAADKIPDTISKEEIQNREDFRGITTFTIDPKDAKDFDDALSARRLANGNWEVGVHIADVTHYVKPDGVIDKEAQSRATSVYLVDRTIPMLPERLCNQICSLRPNEEKLCFSAIFELNNEAVVLNARIGRTIIKSDRRFTYEEAQEVIESGQGDFKEELLALNELAKKLRARRFEQGAINFDRYEVKFEVDEQGKPLRVYFKVSKDANKLIEEFMLLANRTVAEFVGRPPKGKRKKTFVYRIHDGRGHEFPVEVFRGGRNRKRRGRIMYGTMEIYANAEDDDSTVLSLISQLLSRTKTSVYFLPFYDGESLFFFGKRKKITTDRDSLGDPNCFYVEKGEHPIKKYKELFFLYLKKKIVEIGFEMGLDLRRWEVKVGDYRSFFACNAYSRKFFRFDYRNVAYRKDILDALIVHEVCHCYHHNHSKAFYALCERYWPNYRYYDMLLDNGVFNEKLLSPEEREIYLPDFGPGLR